MNILFINTSPKKDGNTVKLARNLLEGFNYKTIHLNDYNICQLGQNKKYDDFLKVFEYINNAQVLVFATPIYWYDMTGSLKLLIDRISEDIKWDESNLAGKNIVFLAQGFMPGERVLEHVNNIFLQFTDRIGMNYLGMLSGTNQVKLMREKIKKLG